jgi:uncharacterized membrane protein YeaQ/YmgE (transglycosylase-associated protein family)
MMSSGTEIVLAWIGIGLCASIAGWIFPFRRGVSGILLNMAVAISGSVGAGLLAFLVGGRGRSLVTTSFLWSLVGAIAALTAAHLLWTRIVHARLRTRRGH